MGGVAHKGMNQVSCVLGCLQGGVQIRPLIWALKDEEGYTHRLDQDIPRGGSSICKGLGVGLLLVTPPRSIRVTQFRFTEHSLCAVSGTSHMFCSLGLSNDPARRQGLSLFPLYR